jgi:hypothetical protein
MPRYTHDCAKCVFLGEHEDHDLYFCDQGGGFPTVLGRYGNDGPEYTSGLRLTEIEGHPLETAKKLAVQRGLMRA